MTTLRIDQVLPSFAKYDAIGHDAFLIQKLLKERGFESGIYAYEATHSPEAQMYEYYKPQDPASDLLIHHFSIGSSLSLALEKVKSFKITRFHNITPHHFFSHPSMIYTRSQCLKGQSQIPFVRSITDYALPASIFNGKEFGFNREDRQSVLPVLKNYDELSSLAIDSSFASRFAQTGKKTLLFVGRMIPHKSQHDLLFLLFLIKKYVDSQTQLVLVGGYDSYYKKDMLRNLAADYNLSWQDDPLDQSFAADVLHFSHLSPNQLASVYHCSHLFVCMSEHEGFGVPLIEAMSFGLPVIAHACSAVTETCGNGGILVDKANWVHMLKQVERLFKEPSYMTALSEKSSKRAKEFSWNQLVCIFDDFLEKLLKVHTAAVRKVDLL